MQPLHSSSHTVQEAETVNFLHYLKMVLKHKRMVMVTTGAALVLSTGVALLLPKVYSATALVLPPQQDQGLMGMMMGQMGGVASLAGDLLGKGSPADVYVTILSSNAVSDTMIDRFKLMDVYDDQYRMEAYKDLDKNVDISAGKKDGVISITVEDEDPQRAADLANAYVDTLDKLAIKYSSSNATENRAFLEERLAKARGDLARAEDAVKAFQTKHKALDVMDQAKATIEGVAQLRAQLALQEVQLQTMRRQFADSAPEVKNLAVTVANLRGQIAKLEGKSSGSSIPSVGSVPALGESFVRLMRDMKTQEAIVELLTKQYEMAKFTEAKNVSTIEVIQKARVPDKKVKPKRALIVLVTTFLGLIGSVFASALLEYRAQMSPEDRRLWQEIRQLAGGGADTGR